jgi:hypothetical protein
MYRAASRAPDAGTVLPVAPIVECGQRYASRGAEWNPAIALRGAEVLPEAMLARAGVRDGAMANAGWAVRM